MTETLPAVDDKIEFVTAKEADAVNKMMIKDWVKADANGKPLKSKDFIYRIISCHPYEKNNVISPMGKFLIMLEVQKFHRNKFVTKDNKIGGSSHPIKENEKVEQHRYTALSDNKMSPDGSWECLDEDANRQVDMKQFLKEFAPDASE